MFGGVRTALLAGSIDATYANYDLALDFKNGKYRQVRTRTNLVPNGDGVGAAGAAVPTRWTADQSYGGVAPSAGATVTMGSGRSGYQFRINGTPATNNRFLIAPSVGSAAASMPVVGGQTYIFAWDVQLISTTGVVPKPLPIVVWYNAADGIISAPGGLVRTATAAAARYSDSFLAPAGAVHARVRFDFSELTASGTPTDFTLAIGGIQFEAAPKASAYIPTTAGARSVLENFYTDTPLRANLVFSSNDFSQSPWSKARATVVAGGAYGQLLKEDTTATNTHNISQNASASLARPGFSTTFAFDVYPAGRTRVKVVLASTNSSGATFDLTGSGSVVDTFGVSGGAVATASIAMNSDGSYRCITTAPWNAANTGLGVNAAIYLVNTGVNISYTGDGASGVYLKNAQLEDGPLATDYIDNPSLSVIALAGAIADIYGASHTRTGAEGNAKASDGTVSYQPPNYPAIIPGEGYLSRSAMTNLLLRSQEFDAANWGALDASGVGSSNPVVTANYTTAPDGTLTADRIQFTRGASGFSRIQQATASQPVGTYTHSIWMKANSGTPTVGLRSSNSGGANVPDMSVTLSSLWQRVPFTITTTVTGTIALEILIWSSIAGTSLTADISVWQAQCVAGTQAGPIIATAGGTAAVGADFLPANTSLADEDFVIFGVATVNPFLTSYIAEVGAGVVNDRIVLYATAGVLTCYISAAGVNLSPTASFASGTGRVCIAVRRRSGKFTFGAKNAAGAISVQAEGAASAMPPVSKIFPGSSNSATAQTSGPVEFIGILRGALTDADLTALLQAA